jgi:hypothetical protein
MARKLEARTHYIFALENKVNDQGKDRVNAGGKIPIEAVLARMRGG